MPHSDRLLLPVMSNKTSKYLKKLKEISQDISVESSLKKQFSIIVRKVLEVMDVDACSIYVLTADDELTLAAAEGIPREAIGVAKVNLNDGITGNIAMQQTLVNTASVSEHPSYFRLNETYSEQLTSYLGVPFVRAGETIGVLAIMSSKKRRFSKVDEAFLSTTATHLAYLLNTSENHDFLEREDCELYYGVSGASGAGIGKAYILKTADLMSVADKHTEDVDLEVSLWEEALQRTLSGFERELTRTQESQNLELSEIVEAYIMIVSSADFQRKVGDCIKQGMWAHGALKKVIYEIAISFFLWRIPICAAAVKTS